MREDRGEYDFRYANTDLPDWKVVGERYKHLAQKAGVEVKNRPDGFSLRGWLIPVQAHGVLSAIDIALPARFGEDETARILADMMASEELRLALDAVHRLDGIDGVRAFLLAMW